MTPTLDASEQFEEMPPDTQTLPYMQDDPIYPTDWHMVNDLLKTEVRQLSFDTYQLRTPTHTIIINQEGFDLSRDGSLAGEAIFEDWLVRNKVMAHPTEFTE